MGAPTQISSSGFPTRFRESTVLHSLATISSGYHPQISMFVTTFLEGNSSRLPGQLSGFHEAQLSGMAFHLMSDSRTLTWWLWAFTGSCLGVITIYIFQLSTRTPLQMLCTPPSSQILSEAVHQFLHLMRLTLAPLFGVYSTYQ